ncbi:hypothetical protein [Microbulbifer sp. TYP-18]|uniref:hypothetical protein n=1 Tax=Microbulbifer sp. TYP-18 TaxID=3230024 RepID=UPI0034C5DE24
MKLNTTKSNLVLLVIMSGAMACIYFYISPSDIFDLPAHLDRYLDIRSYFVQGIASGVLGFEFSRRLKVSRYRVFSIGLLIGILLLILNSIRLNVVDFYFLQYSVIPLLLGIAAGVYLIEYVYYLFSRMVINLTS